MAVAIREEMSGSLQKGLSEWWSEETEHVFQRIERWAAFARGYNRLRSQRLSRGRLTMQEEQEPRWSISSNKIVIEEPAWSPRFHNLKRSHRRQFRSDESRRINCCGTYDYQSNGNIASSCLETYRYDHSIYFKTIGDIKSSKRDIGESRSEIDGASSCSDERVEWDAKIDPDHLEDRRFGDEDDDESNDAVAIGGVDVRLRVPGSDIDVRDVDEPEEQQEIGRFLRDSWPIVDLTKLSLDATAVKKTFTDDANDDDNAQEIGNGGDTANGDDNNNFIEQSVDSVQRMMQLQMAQLTANQDRLNSSINSRGTQQNREGIATVLSLKTQRRSPGKVRPPAVVGENNVLWPGVLLNYTRNIDPESSPHRHRAVPVK